MLKESEFALDSINKQLERRRQELAKYENLKQEFVKEIELEENRLKDAKNT